MIAQYAIKEKIKMLKLYDFSVDYVKNPTIVKTKDLRFGWKLDSDNIDVLQTSYRIIIKNEDGTAADTGIVKSEDVCDITIDSLKLKSCTDYTVEITVTDNKGETAKFARKISTEILPEEWRGASWITYKRMGAVHENKIRGKRRKKSYYVCFGAWVRRILYKRKKNRRLLYRPTYVELRKDGVLQEVRRYGTYQGRRQRAGSAFGRGILLSKPRMGT